ncbi:extracellular endoglucanase precursor [Labilithrix luteola]|uniref:Extracellular endoglucanase n=1 Tax=Labilithrix luteola TaxID=1391654 RepID=A0A0K1PNY5_9BACT|nr:expansin EXLX1 family cellulose-binding protein [Labilithrix luteola]AKU95245.1 extracellular endoglucanase precursor [Labilithrix luteola]
MRFHVLSTLLAAGLVVAACGSDENSTGGTPGDSTTTAGNGSNGGGSSGGGAPLPSSEPSGPRQGIATYYAATGDGNCSFGPSPNAMDVTALNFPEYAGSAACGTCIKVTGPKGEVTVRVVDSCPECEEHHLDLSKEAFGKIAELKAGRIDITYQAVSCNVTGNVQYVFKDGSSKWWTAIQVRNHKLPIAKLEYQKGDGWTAMKRADYNYFLEEGGVGDQPSGLHVRVTSVDGQTLEDTLPGTITPEAVTTGGAQFE